MNEQEFARKLAQRLDASLGDLPAPTLYKLQSIRQQALSRYNAGGGALPKFLPWKFSIPALVLVVAFGAYVLQRGEPADPYELEAQVLTDDLPIHAYLDEGFETWLQKTADD